MVGLDAAFFQRMLRRDELMKSGRPDHDLDMLEQLIPVLAQGLEALARHIDALARARVVDPEARARFRPATWLAQYLLRHHPLHCPTPTTALFAELVELERARREMHKRRDQVAAVFAAQERACPDGVPPNRIHGVIAQIDDLWRLGGVLLKAIPQDLNFAHVIDLVAPKQRDEEPDSPDERMERPEGVVTFDKFWEWFQDFFETHDVVRMADFARGEQARQEEAARAAEEAKLLQERKELADAHEAQLTAKLEAFDELLSRMGADEVIAKIREGQFALQGAEEDDASAPVSKPHVALLVEMLEQWGIACRSSRETWDGYAITAWDEWVEKSGAEEHVVSSKTLDVFLSRERFQQFLRNEQSKEDFGAEYFLEHLGVTSLERERQEEFREME